MSNQYNFTTNIHDLLITKKPSFCYQKLEPFEKGKFCEGFEEFYYRNPLGSLINWGSLIKLCLLLKLDIQL